MHPILDGLNPEQSRAVQTIDGPLLLLAGAGSGKTRVLTHRIAWMLAHGVRPWQILAVTFTNKAAGEMKERVAELVGADARRILVTTFHSACVRFLRRDITHLGYRSSFTIYDSDDQLRLIKTLLSEFKLDPKRHPPRGLRGFIDSAKNKMRKPDLAAASRGDIPEKVFAAYESTLKIANAVDFNDLIGLMVKLLSEHPEVLARYQDRYRYLMVDEYQDTNNAQYQLVQLLARKHRNVAVVGDDDQSIYAFRGADIRNILDFEKDFPDATTIRLERNYRSTRTILQAAGAVVSNNRQRMEKTMWTEAGQGERITLLVGADEEREAELVVQRIRKEQRAGRRPGDFAVIYRSNAASRLFEQAFIHARIPHMLIGAQKFYERREIRDVISYLKLLLNPADDMAFQRVINAPTRGIGAKSVQGIIEESSLRGVPLLEGARGWSMRGRGRARAAAGDFCRMIDSLSRQALELEPAALVRQVVERSGYLARLESEGTPEAQSRMENIHELSRAMEGVEGSADEEDAEGTAEEGPLERLQRFLDRAALNSPTDDIPDAEAGAVTLLTSHLCKGLEFPVVFVVGMYEGAYPHFRSMEKQEDIEEERRLVYVAFTRAREKLLLTRPRRRLVFASGGATRQDVEPSRFIEEIPEELIEQERGFGRRGIGSQQGGLFGRESRAEKMSRLGFGARSAPASRRLPSVRRRASPAPPVEGNYETMVPEDPSQLQVGVQVLHPRFGLGTIRRKSGPPNNLKVQIHFDQHGPKSILVRYASLEIVLT